MSEVSELTPEVAPDPAFGLVSELSPEDSAELPSEPRSESESEPEAESCKPSRSRNGLDESSLCQFSYADGRQCRMLRYHAHPSLCVFHAQAEMALLEDENISEELASISGGFRTQTDLNHVLGNLFRVVAAGRVSASRAKTLSYLAQLLVQTQKHIKYESTLAQDHRNWERLVRAAYPRDTRS